MAPEMLGDGGISRCAVPLVKGDVIGRAGDLVVRLKQVYTLFTSVSLGLSRMQPYSVRKIK